MEDGLGEMLNLPPAFEDMPWSWPRELEAESYCRQMSFFNAGIGWSEGDCPNKRHTP